MKNNILLIELKQALKKHKIKILIKNINLFHLNVLKFLWKNHYIYGFKQCTSIINSYYIFLKYNKQNNFLLTIKQNINLTYKKILKVQKWSKNSLFIIKTHKNFLLNQQ